MTVSVELIRDPEHGGFTARVPGIPAYGEGETEHEAIADLRAALRGYIETFGLQDATSRLENTTLRQIDFDDLQLTRSVRVNGTQAPAVDDKDRGSGKNSWRDPLVIAVLSFLPLTLALAIMYESTGWPLERWPYAMTAFCLLFLGAGWLLSRYWWERRS